MFKQLQSLRRGPLVGSLMFTLLSFLFVNKVSAQLLGAYSFIPSAGTYSHLAGGTNSTATGDDGIQDAIPLGFNFTFEGSVYTHLSISTNGWVKLGNASVAIGGGSWTNNIDYSATAHEPLIAGLWDDDNRGDGSISYLMTGSAPNRVFEVNYDTVYVGGSGSSSGSKASYLIRIYETSNAVEIIYGSTLGTAGSLSASIGLTGLSSYASVTPGATATVSNSTANNSISSTTNLVGQRYLFIPPPPTPPTPTEAVGPPTCSAGITIDMVGPPPTDVQWYWQTTASGTSTANLYSGPYTVFANGTYYARALNTVTNAWSLASSSVTVSDFPTATPPPTPTAGANPACITSGTDLTVTAAPSGYVYYWQGTTVNGSSTALDASTPYHVSVTGTYNVAAYETASGCWSNTVGLSVTVNSYVPAAPTTTLNNYNICSGTMSQLIDATPPAGGSGGSVSANTGTIAVAIPDNNTTGITNDLSISGIPADGVISQLSVQLSITHTFDGDLDIFLKGPNGTQIELSTDNGSLDENYTNTIFTNTASTNITAGIAPFTGSFLPEGNMASLFSVPNGTWSLIVQDDAGGDFGTLTNWSINVTYTQNPPSTLAWYDASTGGALLGTTSPFETVGTSVLPTTNSAGAYSFYAESQSMGCTSATRTTVTINVTEVLAVLSPVNVTCNGGNNGSFTLGAVQCGTAPFMYSLDGGTTFGPIPTNLVAGTYSIIMQDFNMGESAPISLVITEPAAPSALNATNVTYYNATLGWTTTGNETSWTVIYGPTGFDPATSGTTLTGVTNPDTISGDLTPSTTYDFYVFNECGIYADTSGPVSFTTNTGFLAHDNACGPGFIDISSTGTALDYSGDTGEFFEDEREAPYTSPFPITFNGVTSTQMSVGYNGGIILGSLTAEQYGYLYDPAAGQSGIFVFAEDLDVPEGVYSQVTGTAPNRRLIIQWHDAPAYLGDETFNFEAIFYETTGDLYFVYDDVTSSDPNENLGNSASIGVMGQVDVSISEYDDTYLTNNSCVHFYPALCPNITNFDAIVYPDDALLSWDAGLYGETNWTLIYGPEGFDPTVPGQAIDTFDLSTNGTDFAGTLSQLTTYDVYIYSDCQADNIVSDGFFGQFTTLPVCSNPSNLVGTTDVDSLELTWNFTAFAGYPVTGFNIQYGMNGQTPFMADAVGINPADTIHNTALIAGGVYQVYIQAECDATNDTSSWVGPITVIMPLSNDSVCGAEVLTLGTSYTLNNVGAGVSIDETNIAPPATGAQTTTGWANSTLNNTTWFTFVAPASGSVRINNTAINYNGQAAVYKVSDCGDFNSNFLMVAANDNAIGGTSLAPNFTVCGLTPGSTYYLMHDGTGTTGNYSIMITPIILQAGSAAPLTKICTGSSVDLFTTISGYDQNGVWSASVVAANASITDSVFNSAGLGYNVFNFQYRMTDGCAYDSIVSQVQVYGLSNAGTDGGLTVCKNEPVDLLSGLGGTVDVDGTWYDPSHTSLTSSAIDASQFPGSFNYDYVTGNGVCPDDTSHVVVTVLSNCDYLSVDEAMFEGVQLYPNPTTGIINIDADKAFVVSVTDANGRTIIKKLNAVQGTTTIDLSQVQVGVYFVTLRNEAASKVFRVVVQ